jgi:hypothetical protein
VLPWKLLKLASGAQSDVDSGPCMIRAMRSVSSSAKRRRAWAHITPKSRQDYKIIACFSL